MRLHLNGLVGHELQIGPFVVMIYYKFDERKPYYRSKKRIGFFYDKFWRS